MGKDQQTLQTAFKTSYQAVEDGPYTTKHGHQLISQHCDSFVLHICVSTQQSSNYQYGQTQLLPI